MDLLLNIVAKYGLIGLFILTIVQSIIPPIPSDLIVFSLTLLKVNPSLATIVSTAGLTIGSAINYYVGLKGLRKIVVKLLNRKSVAKAEEIIEKHGVKAVFVLRLIPLASIDAVSYAAGVLRPDFKNSS